MQCGVPAQHPEQQQAGQPAQLGAGAAPAPGSPSWDELEDGDDDDAPSWDLLDELAAAPSPPDPEAGAGAAGEQPAAAADAAAAWEAPRPGQPAAPVPAAAAAAAAAAAETAPELGWGADDYEAGSAEANACAGEADWESPPERQQAAAVPAPHQQQQAQQQATTGRRQSALSTGRRRRLRSIFADEDEDEGFGGLGAQVGLGRPGGRAACCFRVCQRHPACLVVQLHLFWLHHTEASFCHPIANTCRPSHLLLLQPPQPATAMMMLT